MNFWQGLQNVGVKIPIRIRNQNWLFHGAEQRQVRLAIAQANRGETGPLAGVVKLHEFANGAAFIASNGDMPESPAEGQRCFSFGGFLLESMYGVAVPPGDEERLVEIALFGEGGFARREAGVLRDLAGSHIVEADNGDSHGFGNFFEHGECLAVRARQGQTEIARVALDAGNLQVEVAIGNEYSAAVFRDEWMRVTEFPAKGIDFRAGLAGDQNERDAAALDFREGGFRAGPRIVAGVEKSSVEIGED